MALIAASPAHACTPSALDGVAGPFADTLCGTSGTDVLDGKGGDDTIFGLGGPDILHGGDGLDVIYGGSGNDLLDGGPGGSLLGFADSLDGGSGNDHLDQNDGNVDNFHINECGSGTDTLDMDLLDAGRLTGLLGFAAFLGCESFNIEAVNEGPNVVISRHSVNVGTDGQAAVRLRCPGSLTAPCAGTLRLGRSPKTEGTRTHYSIDQGKKDNVSARLSRRDRRRLRRHGEATAAVTSVEQGQFGDKTTIQTLKLIAQG